MLKRNSVYIVNLVSTERRQCRSNVRYYQKLDRIYVWKFVLRVALVISPVIGILDQGCGTAGNKILKINGPVPMA